MDPTESGEQQVDGGATAAPADVSDEALLAELDAELGTESGVEEPAAKAKADPDDDEEEGEEPDESEDDDATEADDEDDDEEKPDEEKPDAAAKDPELAKRLAQVRRTEERQRQALQREREAFDRERSEWQSQRQQISESQKRFETLSARAKLDPAGVLEALGVDVDGMEYAAQQTYARSKAAAADPKYRAAADRAMRDREAADKAASAEERVTKLEQTIAEREQQAAADRVLDTLFGRVFRKADDSTPRVKALIAKNPAKARAELEQTAFELAKKLGALPKSKAVLAAHEKKIARQLRDYGVDDVAAPAAGDKKPAATAKPGKPAVVVPDKKPGAKPVVEPPPRKPNGELHHPSREELLEELDALS